MRVRDGETSCLLPFFICAILAMRSQQGTTTLAEFSQRKMELKSCVPSALSAQDPLGTTDLDYRELF